MVEALESVYSRVGPERPFLNDNFTDCSLERSGFEAIQFTPTGYYYPPVLNLRISGNLELEAGLEA